MNLSNPIGHLQEIPQNVKGVGGGGGGSTTYRIFPLSAGILHVVSLLSRHDVAI